MRCRRFHHAGSILANTKSPWSRAVRFAAALIRSSGVGPCVIASLGVWLAGCSAEKPHSATNAPPAGPTASRRNLAEKADVAPPPGGNTSHADDTPNGSNASKRPASTFDTTPRRPSSDRQPNDGETAIEGIASRPATSLTPSPGMPNTRPATSPTPAPVAKAAPVFRPSDTRRSLDAGRLRTAGIAIYESKRLKLVTDVPKERVAHIPALVDRAYEAWEEYFGPLPADRERREFQMSGFVMHDKVPFTQLGLLPEDLPRFEHGRHRGAEFWLNDQTDDYYLRHLILHEATHCFMTIVPHPAQNLTWYMEGMAELFGTHTLSAAGAPGFRVFPANREDFRGWGRVRMIREAGEKTLTLVEVLDLRPDEFLRTECYAWSWALCQFLDTHPRYRERFRKLSTAVSPRAARADFEKLFADDWPQLADEWLHFARTIREGYDIERAAIRFVDGKRVPSVSATGAPTEPAVIDAAAGWQSTAWRLERGVAYEISATGRFTLAQQPKPWISEADGVSIRFVDGHPLGMLLGTVYDPPAARAGSRNSGFDDIFPIGAKRVITPPRTGTLYLRLGDAWNELGDNSGQVTVSVREIR